MYVCVYWCFVLVGNGEGEEGGRVVGGGGRGAGKGGGAGPIILDEMAIDWFAVYVCVYLKLRLFKCDYTWKKKEGCCLLQVCGGASCALRSMTLPKHYARSYCNNTFFFCAYYTERDIQLSI